MLSVQNSFYSASAIDLVYSSMAGKISNLPSTILLTNPDRYTGISFTSDFLRVSLADNAERTSSVNAGISLVQSAADVVETISSKVDAMKQLAQQATNTPAQEDREALQEQFDALSDEVNAIATQFSLGGGNMLSKDDDAVEVSIGGGLSIDIDTKDMTIRGLGIIDNIDIVNSPADAVTGLESAQVQISSYADHLDSKAGDLGSALNVLDAQSQSLLAVQAGIESAGSAMLVAGSFSTNYTSQTDMFFVAQANVKLLGDTVLQLLSD
ncbi:MAG: flagellin N-terminal helical domain-containing protein [Planctomycetota bacterium]|jgi:flagellin-like hook-associated protein FlgL